MKLILLFLCFIKYSYCLEMIEVSRNLRTSLPTEVSIDKYFYLTNSNYHPHSNYIYICFEDNNFGLSDIGVKYCLTNTDPISYPNKAVSGCFFSTIYYYYKQSSSGIIKYYYKISTSSSYYYCIVNYQGGYSLGKLYVTSDYNDLVPIIKMTRVSRNSRTTLPTTSQEDKYFYLTNSDYSNFSKFIYISLEDNNFNLNYNKIKYCFTNTNPYMYHPDSIVSSCSFNLIYHYSSQSSSGTTKYYYNISIPTYYSYSIVYYEGNNSSGYLYVISDYNNFIQTVKMTKVSRNSRTSLPTANSEDKYFYLTNSNYSNYSSYISYIYICLEDNNFHLNYNNIKYCFTNTNPSSYPDIAIKNCSFISISYYSTQSSSDTIKYYYKISISISYTYSIVSYEGNNSSGNLHVTSDYNNFIQTVKMTQVSINSRTSLPTTSSEDKYFYLTNNNYSNYSSYIYICLEDNNFGLNYNKIKYCHTNTNPYMYPDSAARNCSFNLIYHYSSKSSSGTIKYYYNISTSSSYTYSIVYYEGNNSSGYLYVTSDYKSISNEDNNKDGNKDDKRGISTGVIIGIAAGSIVVLVTFIIIIYFCCKCYGKDKIGTISDPLNQPENLLPNDNPIII